MTNASAGVASDWLEMEGYLPAPGLGLTRRTLLERMAGMGGAGLLLAGMEALGYGIGSASAAPPVLPHARAGTRLLIIGAGVAGLATAIEARKAGYEVEIVEARAEPGGRARTARRGSRVEELGGTVQTCAFDENLCFNLGAWRIPYHHHSTLHYARDLKVPLEIFVNDNDASYLYFENGSGPLARRPVRKGQIAADARGHAAEMLAKVAGRGGLDDLVSAEDRDRLTAYLIGEGYLSAKELIYSGTNGRGYDVQPGAGLAPGPGQASTPYAMADILHSDTWRVLASVADWDQQRTMFQPIGGMDRIANAMAAAVGTGIHYSAVVERISQSPGGVTVQVRGPGGRPSAIVGDFVVCTIPLSVLRSVDMDVSPAFKQAIATPAYLPAGKIGLQMGRRFWETDHNIYGGHVYTDNLDIQTMTFPSSDWLGRKGIIQGYYNFAGHAAKVSALKPEGRAELAIAFGEKVMPEYRASYEASLSIAWHLIPYSLGAFCEWSVDARARAYARLCEPDGRIYLAGEHLSYLTGWQAGAIESAWQQLEKIHRRVLAQ